MTSNHRFFVLLACAILNEGFVGVLGQFSGIRPAVFRTNEWAQLAAEISHLGNNAALNSQKLIRNFMSSTGGNQSNDNLDRNIVSLVGEVGSLHPLSASRGSPVAKSDVRRPEKTAEDAELKSLNSALLLNGFPSLPRKPNLETMATSSAEDDVCTPQNIGDLTVCLNNGRKLPKKLLEQFKDDFGTSVLKSFTLPPVSLPDINEGLARSAWPATHRTGYAQAASPYRGPDGSHRLSLNFLNRAIVVNNPITLFYSDDNKYLWGSSWTTVFKVSRSPTSLKLVDYLTKPLEKVFSDKFHGAYGLMTKENAFVIASGDKLEAYYDVPGTNGSKIMQHPVSYDLSDDLRGEKRFPAIKEEVIRGICMSHDGNIVWASSHGRVGVISRDLTNADSFKKSKAWLMLGELHQEHDLEMSNNIACDEDGGIYIVTDIFMHKLVWKNGVLTTAWETSYGNRSKVTEAARLGAGSGSTPSIMGSGDRKYVVITDSEDIMNVLILDAEKGKIIDKHPINFGDESALKTVSEQSVLVHGWRLVVVNNTPSERLVQESNLVLPALIGNPASLLLRDKDLASEIGKTLQNAWPVIVGDAPKGVEQLEFDPETGKLRVTWINRDVSIPNGIPSMSVPTELMYGIGKRGHFGTDAAAMRGMWTLEAIDWWTGESKFYYNIGLGPWTNSIYAATQVGPNEVITGTAGGIVRIFES